MTQFAGRKEPVGYEKLLTSPSCLVLQLSPEFGKSHVADNKSEMVIFEHSIDIQIFDRHYTWPLAIWLGFRYNSTRGLVQCIPSDVCDALVQFRYLPTCLFPILAALLSS